MTLSDQQRLDEALEQLKVIRFNVEAFRGCLLDEVSADTDPITPKVAFKLLAYREALSWRAVELGEAAESSIQSGNYLSGVVLTRSLLECAAAYHFLCKKLRKCIDADSVEELDEAAMKLLLGSRWDDWEFGPTNILTMIDGANKECPGIRENYDLLSEYAHPNYSGVARIFSEPGDALGFRFGRYVRGRGLMALTATNSLTAALMLFEHYYNSSAELFPKIVQLCHRDLETNLNRSSQP
ncbi:hypothetical protein KBY27_09385 [Ruegeria pomeroyi]|uniref:Uncharacterized protein n=1 Tax=Ruegeria pomeroyi TaxID=89184 RepID=A0A9Q3WKN1_9RHOB|nr:hypothetical protein [Ruegeria pomeroyi]MCE8537669.1 hypothetical protein [Ruegeria pomeroyi]